MKGNKKILAVAVLLLLIAVGYGTYAIYRESATGAATIDAATWSVKIGTGQDQVAFADADFDFDFTDLTCTTLTGYNNTIAPGTECYIDYAIDASGSEVDVLVEVDEDNSTVPEPLEVSVEGTDGVLEIPYSSTASEMQKTLRINVVWPGALTDNDTKDETDLDLNGDELSFSVKLTARQSLEHHS